MKAPPALTELVVFSSCFFYRRTCSCWVSGMMFHPTLLSEAFSIDLYRPSR
jgi:hypothetical protein